MTNLLKTKKVLSALLLVAIVAAVSVFLIAANKDSPVVTADHSSVSGDAELDDLQFMADQGGYHPRGVHRALCLGRRLLCSGRGHQGQ